MSVTAVGSATTAENSPPRRRSAAAAGDSARTNSTPLGQPPGKGALPSSNRRVGPSTNPPSETSPGRGMGNYNPEGSRHTSYLSDWPEYDRPCLPDNRRGRDDG